MYKRVAKRIARKREEEELGLTEEVKEILGLQATDSEESASDFDGSAPSGSEDESSEDGEPKEFQGFGDEEEDGDSSENSSEDSPEPFSDAPPMSIKDASRSPLYELSDVGLAKACVICPGKLLKGAPMAEAHLTSSAHVRRVKRFELYRKEQTQGGRSLETKDPRVIIRQMDSAIRKKEAAEKGEGKKKVFRKKSKRDAAKRRKEEAKSRIGDELTALQNAKNGAAVSDTRQGNSKTKVTDDKGDANLLSKKRKVGEITAPALPSKPGEEVNAKPAIRSTASAAKQRRDIERSPKRAKPTQ